MESQGTNHDITPSSKVQHPDAQWGWLRTGCLWVSAVELSDKLFEALYILGGVPFIFFNTITFPLYQVLNLSTKHPTIENIFDFVLFDAIMDDWMQRQWVVFLALSDWVSFKGSQESD